MKILMIAYYLIKKIGHPKQIVEEHKKILSELNCKGRIYIGIQGLNVQISIAENDLPKYVQFLKSKDLFDSDELKIHIDHTHRFDKLIIKYREQIVAIDRDVDFSKTADHISPSEWAKKIEDRDDDTIIIDVRNDYESEVGYFEGAIKPQLGTFREFNEFTDKLAKIKNKKDKTVLMYCTGGIRCEFYSPLLKEKGFDNVYQLKGGVIGYGLAEGSRYWKGKLFVFDDRLVVPISKDNNEVIGKCRFCDSLTDLYYNCANMDCNSLFLSCKDCAIENKGCCKSECSHKPRVRTMRKVDESERPVPFRKLTHEQKQR